MSIFVCYAHNDEVLKDRLVNSLKPVTGLGGTELFHDGLIKPGEPWRRTLDDALARANAALLLVSNAFLTSAFIQVEEVPSLINSFQKSGLKLFPVLARQCTVPTEAPWQFWFPRDDSRSPLDERDDEAFERFTAALCAAIHALIPPLAAETEIRDLAQDEASRRRFADGAAAAYPKDRFTHLSALTDRYLQIYYHLRQPDEAKDLATKFWDALKRVRSMRKAIPRVHQEVLELLMQGLPEYSGTIGAHVHLAAIESLRKGLLERDGCAALLAGIGRMKQDYRPALEHLDEIATTRTSLRGCVLLQYARGQCLRKLKQLELAIAAFGEARDRLTLWSPSPHDYECGLNCGKDALRFQIHRGLGTAYRSQKRWEEAMAEFRAGEPLLDGADKKIAADFRYSYGYCAFEFAWSVDNTADGETYRTSLIEARDQLQQSHRLNRQWSAPLARLLIVEQLLEGKCEVEGFLKARIKARAEASMESMLTAALCEVAILLNDANSLHSFQERIGFTAQDVYWGVYDHFDRSGFRIAEAARECHLFDLNVIIESSAAGRAALECNEWLHRTHLLLEDSVQWRDKTLEQQRDSLWKFQQRHRIPDRESPETGSSQTRPPFRIVGE